MAASATLRLHCTVSGQQTEPIPFRIFEAGTQREIFSGAIPPNSTLRVPLPEGAYRISVRASARTDPGGITKWLSLRSGQECPLRLFFRSGVGERTGAEPEVCVCLTAVDANHPNITPLTGRIQVWQSRTMRSIL